jgi:hypothetical protein
MILSAAMFALLHFRFIYFLDWCEGILQITDQNRIPDIGMGISSYLSCLPDFSTDYSASLGYQFNTEYQKGLILVNDRLQDLKVNNA